MKGGVFWRIRSYIFFLKKKKNTSKKLNYASIDL